jgi:hypothetical protein
LRRFAILASLANKPGSRGTGYALANSALPESDAVVRFLRNRKKRAQASSRANQHHNRGEQNGNACDQQFAAKGLSTTLDAIANLLQGFPRHALVLR